MVFRRLCFAVSRFPNAHVASAGPLRSRFWTSAPSRPNVRRCSGHDAKNVDDINPCRPARRRQGGRSGATGFDFRWNGAERIAEIVGHDLHHPFTRTDGRLGARARPVKSATIALAATAMAKNSASSATVTPTGARGVDPKVVQRPRGEPAETTPGPSPPGHAAAITVG
jgi:hypothetical protein